MVTGTGGSWYTTRRALVTGAGGFIGSHLVEHLVRAGASVRAMVRYNSSNDWGLLADVPPKVRFPVSEYWLDIGHLEDCRRAQDDVKNGRF